jgi:2-polyprenyl-3-methyl-5-hydroxy-6-metoxy-1,4-benzoquinol methylase
MRPGRDRAALARALARYTAAPLMHRVFLHGRAFLSDLTLIESYVPRQGFVVDLGCGHGLFANLLCEASSRRRVLGVDADARKIAVAELTQREGLRFSVSDIVAEPPPPCDCVTIVDVLYLLPFADQERVLRNCASALPEGGRLVLKAQESRADPRYALTYAQELIATGLGITRGGRAGLFFPTREQTEAMFAAAGFAIDLVPMPRRPYTDVLYLGRRLPR